MSVAIGSAATLRQCAGPSALSVLLHIFGGTPAHVWISLWEHEGQPSGIPYPYASSGRYSPAAPCDASVHRTPGPKNVHSYDPTKRDRFSAPGQMATDPLGADLCRCSFNTRECLRGCRQALQCRACSQSSGTSGWAPRRMTNPCGRCALARLAILSANMSFPTALGASHRRQKPSTASCAELIRPIVPDLGHVRHSGPIRQTGWCARSWTGYACALGACRFCSASPGAAGRGRCWPSWAPPEAARPACCPSSAAAPRGAAAPASTSSLACAPRSTFRLLLDERLQTWIHGYSSVSITAFS